MKVLASPAFSNKMSNPYNWLLYKEVQRLGHEVSEGSGANLRILWNLDVWHIHWPESCLNSKSRATAVLGSSLVLTKALVCKLFRVKIVWTVHNLRPHERSWPILERFFYFTFPRLVDGFVFLSEETRLTALTALPYVTAGKTWVIPHGHYTGIYRCDLSREKAKKKMEIPDVGTLFLYFGIIRPYKNVPALLGAFAETYDNTATLAIVGGATGQDQLAAKIEKLGSSDKRVRTVLRFLSQEDLACWITASDVVVLPYSDIANSGSALLALSLARPVLVPNRGSMPELQGAVGDEWVMLFDGEINANTLAKSATWASLRRTAAPALDAFDWDRIAGLTVDVYKSVTN